MRVGTRAAVAAVLTSFTLATAGPAMAGSGNGVHVDPGSPAGKQYAIPIPSARSETSGPNGAAGSANPPLFGVGVTPGGAAATGGASGTTANSSGTATGGSTRARAESAARRRSVSHRKRTGSAATTPIVRSSDHTSPVSNAVGGTSWLPLLGGGALVLLIGGGGGFFLRRSL
jgi:hypothetical protein